MGCPKTAEPIEVHLEADSCEFKERCMTTLKQQQLECGPMPKVMAAQPNTGGAVCESSAVPSLYHAKKFAWRPLLECRAVTLPI